MAYYKVMVRQFSGDDLMLIERASVIHDGFVIDKDGFEAAFPMFADPFASEFEALIDTALSIPNDADHLCALPMISEKIEKTMDRSREALQRLYRYAEIAFGTYGALMSLGKGNYKKVSKSHSLMVFQLGLTYDLVNDPEYKSGLIAAGFTLADIAELTDLQAELYGQGKLLQDKKTARFLAVEERINLMNAVWKTMQQINKASKVVFAKNPAKLKEYLLYPNKKKPGRKKKPKMAKETAETAVEITSGVITV